MTARLVAALLTALCLSLVAMAGVCVAAGVWLWAAVCGATAPVCGWCAVAWLAAGEGEA